MDGLVVGEPDNGEVETVGTVPSRMGRLKTVETPKAPDHRPTPDTRQERDRAEPVAHSGIAPGFVTAPFEAESNRAPYFASTPFV